MAHKRISLAASMSSLLLALVAGCSGGGGGSNTASDPSSATGQATNNGAVQTNASEQTKAAGTNPLQMRPPDEIVTASGGSVATTGPTQDLANAPAPQPTSERDAFRLLQQATFGANEASIAETTRKGPRAWLAEQFATPISKYGYTTRDAIHTLGKKDFCMETTVAGTPARDNCWRDWYSADPLKFEFFIQASSGTDQLRQRMGFALSQIFVVSNNEVYGTYGLSDYFQLLRDRAFTNYRDVMRGVATHPIMGQYLNMVNNDAADPNENFARELLQLFAVGTCELNANGSMKGGTCTPTYDNSIVRDYAYALTGWTYPVGGVDPYCDRATNPYCGWTNPEYLKGSMVNVPAKHDKAPRKLLSGINLAAGHTPDAALEAVLDSVMNHPNMAPFVSLRMIQALVKSNPSPDYILRVGSAFNSGKFETFGTGVRGDLQSTIAAVLLDAEARDGIKTGASAISPTAGMKREPVLQMINAVRAFNGFTDGDRMGIYGFGSELSQPVFNSPSVFNFFSPEYRLPGRQDLYAPQFQLSNANTNLTWPNFVNQVIYWWYNKGAGLPPKPDVVGATGTKIDYVSFEKDAPDTSVLVDRLDRLLTGGSLSKTAKAAVVAAVNEYTPADTWLTDPGNASSWQRERFKTAAYLLLASPHYQIQK
jgi:uncharacterized protein (DUF1800 family)